MWLPRAIASPSSLEALATVDALGTQKPDKVFSQYDGGHANLLTRPHLIGEILDWLDKYLGPVDLRAARR